MPTNTDPALVASELRVVLGRIVRRLKPSAENFAAAAAVYSPDLMLQLKTAGGD